MVMISDSALRLSQADAESLAAELNDLVERWRVQGKSAGPAARTYQLLRILRPARNVALMGASRHLRWRLNSKQHYEDSVSCGTGAGS